ncbi:unnamed protein product [Amoebophrya sp. A25]|nr:unnamed protein product [Amoebophrya sp. A25]|eukprot:GSA25T00013485001.1
MVASASGLDGVGANFGLMNALRTGNVILDMLICMLIPVVLGWISSVDLKKLVRLFQDYFVRKPDTHVRSIEFVEGRRRRSFHLVGDGGNSENEDRNHILQKAISLYMQERYPAFRQEDMECNLIKFQQIEVKRGAAARGYYERRMEMEEQMRANNFQQLKSFRVQLLPAKETWAEVEPGLFFWHSTKKKTVSSKDGGASTSGEGAETETHITYIIRAEGMHCQRRVDKFIEDAYAWYLKQKEGEVDDTRFFFLGGPEGGGFGGAGSSSSSNSSKFKFKKYQLSDSGKTFGNLFFREKESLLRLVDDFEAKRSKFAIDGFPHKLGLLLDGPPGTGKTSLIKALAAYTKRHVVSVNLAQLQTNQQLMDLMFDLVFPVDGEDLPGRMSFDKIIFVMEDIDAASSVVYKRAENLPNYANPMAAAMDMEPEAVGSNIPGADGVATTGTGIAGTGTGSAAGSSGEPSFRKASIDTADPAVNGSSNEKTPTSSQSGSPTAASTPQKETGVGGGVSGDGGACVLTAIAEEQESKEGRDSTAVGSAKGLSESGQLDDNKAVRNGASTDTIGLPQGAGDKTNTPPFKEMKTGGLQVPLPTYGKALSRTATTESAFSTSHYSSASSLARRANPGIGEVVILLDGTHSYSGERAEIESIEAYPNNVTKYGFRLFLSSGKRAMQWGCVFVDNKPGNPTSLEKMMRVVRKNETSRLLRLASYNQGDAGILLEKLQEDMTPVNVSGRDPENSANPDVSVTEVQSPSQTRQNNFLSNANAAIEEAFSKRFDEVDEEFPTSKLDEQEQSERGDGVQGIEMATQTSIRSASIASSSDEQKGDAGAGVGNQSEQPVVEAGQKQVSSASSAASSAGAASTTATSKTAAEKGAKRVAALQQMLDNGKKQGPQTAEGKTAAQAATPTTPADKVEAIDDKLVDAFIKEQKKDRDAQERSLDKLNLAGLLNVLDGVVDTPGRIVVMTSNHPEKLDPALIRPGRINKRIHLGYVELGPALQMISHYMQLPFEQMNVPALNTQMKTDPEAEKLLAVEKNFAESVARLRLIIQTRTRLTPAMLEQVCAEAAGIDELANMLELLCE